MYLFLSVLIQKALIGFQVLSSLEDFYAYCSISWIYYILNILLKAIQYLLTIQKGVRESV